MTRFTVVILFLLFCCGLTANAQVPPTATAKTTTIARDLSFRGLDANTQIRMADYENQTMVIVIWASWCPPCRLSLTELMTLKRQSFPKTPFPIIALSIEDPTKAEADLRQSLDVLTYKEPAGWIDEKAPLAEGRNSVPQVLVVKNLKVLKRYIGWHPRNVQEIRKLLTTALKTP